MVSEPSPGMLGLLLTTFSLVQAQACLLLQKTLSARELRVCFEDPEWEQLIGQVLAKVAQVTAVKLPP